MISKCSAKASPQLAEFYYDDHPTSAERCTLTTQLDRCAAPDASPSTSRHRPTASDGSQPDDGAIASPASSNISSRPTPDMSSAAVRQLRQQMRRIAWTGAIAAVTVTGAWYGAGLKIQSEEKKAREEAREAPVADKIAQLETYRASLVSKQIGLEQKIKSLQAKREQREKALGEGKDGQ